MPGGIWRRYGRGATETSDNRQCPPCGGKGPAGTRVGGYRRRRYQKLVGFDSSSTNLDHRRSAFGLKPHHQPFGWFPSSTGGGLLVVDDFRFYLKSACGRIFSFGSRLPARGSWPLSLLSLFVVVTTVNSRPMRYPLPMNRNRRFLQEAEISWVNW